MSAIRSLWPFIRPYKRYLCIGGLLAALEVLVNLAQPWPLKWIVDDLTHATPTGTTSIALSCLAFGLIVGTTAILDYWSTRILSSTGLHLANSVREATFSHLNRLSLRFHGNHRVGDLTTRITSDADRAQDMVVQGLAVLAPNAMLLVGMATIMIVLDPTFALLALALTPLLAFVVQHSSKALKRAERLARTAGGEVASAATETLSAMPLIQAYTLEDSQNERVVRLSRHSLDAGLDAVRHQARFSPAVDASAALSIIGVLWFGAIRVRAGVLTVGELLVFVSYVGSVYKPMKALSKLGRVISKGEAATQRIIEVLDEQPQIADRPTAAPARRLHGSIDFADVSFRYGPGAETVLSHVTLSIEAGQTVALVGPTGAGKTTVASLVPRLIEASSGSVLLDGIDVRDYTLRSIREQVSIVLQDSVLLHGTIRHNIALGRRGATTRDVERAAGLALVDEFANRLPLGLDTPIGERGANLSGGQRQRIAIARAILRDAPILILDEPTSALDGASETLIVESLDNLPANRTTIIIAHRLSTVRRADRILVVDGGCIVEDGSHDALTRLGGRYARLLSPEPTGLTSLLSTTGVAR